MLNEQQRKLVEDNHSLIYGYAHSRDIDLEEWYGILAIELCEAVKLYDSSKGSLSTIFYIKADNRMANEYRKNETAKRSNEGEIPFDENSEHLVGVNVEFDGLDLSWVEPNVQEIIKMRIDGYTQSEIADKVGLTQSYISKLLGEFRKELMEREFNDG